MAVAGGLPVRTSVAQEKTMGPFKIVIDREACVGDGQCREIAGNTFDIDCETRTAAW